MNFGNPIIGTGKKFNFLIGINKKLSIRLRKECICRQISKKGNNFTRVLFTCL